MRLIDTEDPERRAMTPVLWCIWAVWTVGVCLLLARHEMWRDELQAWSIARSSSDPIELLRNIRYEGHPPAWHLLLWVASRFTRAPVALAVINATMASATTWLVLRFAPFTLTVRVLFVLGYYPLYELGALARSYGLLTLATVAFVILAGRRRTWSAGMVVALLVMAGTHLLALPLVAGLTLGRWVARGTERWRTTAAITAAVAVVGLAFVVGSWSPSDGRAIEARAPTERSIERVLGAPTDALLPVPPATVAFWDHFVTDDLGWAKAALGAVTLVGVGVAVRRSRAALVTWGVGASGFAVAIAGLGLPLAARHVSVLWLTFVAAVWTAGNDAVHRATEEQGKPVRTAGARRVLVASAGAAVLVAAALGSWRAVAVEVAEPFSGGPGAAAWIEVQAAGRPYALLCVARLYSCSAVSMQLDQPVYIRADGEPSEYVVWRRNRPAAVTGDAVLAEAAALRQRTGADVMVVTTVDDAPAGCRDGWVSPPTIVPTETMVVCRADQLRAGPS